MYVLIVPAWLQDVGGVLCGDRDLTDLNVALDDRQYPLVRNITLDTERGGGHNINQRTSEKCYMYSATVFRSIWCSCTLCWLNRISMFDPLQHSWHSIGY